MKCGTILLEYKSKEKNILIKYSCQLISLIDEVKISITSPPTPSMKFLVFLPGSGFGFQFSLDPDLVFKISLDPVLQISLNPDPFATPESRIRFVPREVGSESGQYQTGSETLHGFATSCFWAQCKISYFKII